MVRCIIYEFSNYDLAGLFCSALKSKVQGLSTAGCTALGPALAVSVAMASDRPTSSEIILCTDGVPNTGVGSLSGRRDTTGFYNTVSSKSKDTLMD